MYTRVLAFLPLFVVLAHSFPWDIVVGAGKRLKFYKNGALTHREDIPSAKKICSVTYDPVHFRVLFADQYNMNLSISSYDLTTRKIQTLTKEKRRTNMLNSRLAYDPVTELLFWIEDNEIYSISLKAAVDKPVHKRLVVTLNHYSSSIAVDSCEGYIYWATHNEIERAAFDGSERAVLLKQEILFRPSLAIDQQTQKMYWIEVTEMDYDYSMSIIFAELNGKNNRTFYYKDGDMAGYLAISNDSIFWKSHKQKAIMQLSKNEQHAGEPIVYSMSGTHLSDSHNIAANYTIMEQTRGTKTCEALKSLIPKSPVSNTSDIGPPNVSVNEECSSTCLHYCFRGKCSVDAEGYPKCSCEAGYSGERCQVDACYKHCLHGGICSLNEEEEPVCQCTADYEGERCDVAITYIDVHADYATQPTQRDLRNEVKAVIKEELQRALQVLTDYINE